MTETTLDVSVIVCAYTEERWHDLVAAVESLQQQTHPPCEIIVVIDHNPALLARVQTHLPGVIAVENREERGLSGARNSGIVVSQSALIAFLDDDAVAELDWLVQLSGCCTDPQVLGAGGSVEPLWSGQRPTWFPEEFYWVVGCSYRGLPEKLAVVRNPLGCCACYRREIFEIVGGFRNGIGRVGKHPLGGEETELCIRAKHYWPQKVFLCEPHARIHHRVPPLRANWHYFRWRCYAEGLSKALVAGYVGAKDGLASERSYVRRTLPQGVIRGLTDTFIHRDLSELARAGAIVVGLAATTAGYLVGRTLLQVAKVKSIFVQEELRGSSDTLLPTKSKLQEEKRSMHPECKAVTQE
jgi:glucosyl-dolichyl phosphate glucuronosyltransferase